MTALDLSSTREASFGPLILSLKIDRTGALEAVTLPKEPPHNLSLDHLQAARAALDRFSLPPAKSPAEAAFRAALTLIPPGQTLTYGQIAAPLGTSPRAIGRWCASNLLLLRIPCHRVVAATGLSGFRAGVQWKRLLLELEA